MTVSHVRRLTHWIHYYPTQHNIKIHHSMLYPILSPEFPRLFFTYSHLHTRSSALTRLMHTSTRLDLQIRFQKPNTDISEQIYSRDSQLKNLSGRLPGFGTWGVPWKINEITLVKCTKCKGIFPAKQKLLVVPGALRFRDKMAGGTNKLETLRVAAVKTAYGSLSTS